MRAKKKMQSEIEIKIKIEKKDNIVKKLVTLGGIPGRPYKQITYGFFSENSIENGIFPRIRKEHDKTVFTVKVRPKKKSNYFERKEYSIIIDNTKAGIKILEVLGFDKIRTFTKMRQEWKFKNVKISLDKLYFGTFLEIEGSKNKIEDMVKKLRFQNKTRIIKSYLALEDEITKK